MPLLRIEVMTSLESIHGMLEQAFATSTMIKRGNRLTNDEVPNRTSITDLVIRERVFFRVWKPHPMLLLQMQLLMKVIEYTDLIKISVLLFLMIMFESVSCVRCVCPKIHVSSAFHEMSDKRPSLKISDPRCCDDVIIC